MTSFSGHLTDAQAQRLLDGVLRAEEAAEVAGHAAACRECTALIESYRALSLALDALPGPELPSDFTAGVLQRVEEGERTAARERWAAAAVLGGILAALAVAVLVGGNGAWVPTAARLAEQLGAVSSTLRLGAEVLPPVVGALRVPIAAASAALALPLLFALSRLIPSPRTEAT